MAANFLWPFRDWYNVGFAYSHQMLPLFGWTAISFVACLALAILFIRKGGVAIASGRPGVFVAAIGIPWGIHAFILYLSFVQLELFLHWNNYHMKPAEWATEVLLVRRAVVGMGLMSSISLVVATFLWIRGTSPAPSGS